MEELYQKYLQHQTVCTDTRKIESGCIFFALKGDNFNGNRFAQKALEAGAAFSVIDEAEFKTDERFILVDDVLKAMQQLATYHRSNLAIPVIAIAGSNGKTTTKELISSVLSTQFSVLSSPGNFNNHIGLPLTLLQIKPVHEIAIIEMGANHIGENAFLCEIAQPNCGLVTNNGKDHLEGFGSLEGVAKSNSELYYYLMKHDGLAFVNAHDEWLMRMATRLSNKKTYAANFAGRVTIADCVCLAKQLQPNILFSIRNSLNSQAEISSSLSGDYNFDNILAAVAIGLHFGLSEEQIKQGIETYEPKNNRSQIIKTAGNTIYMDAYNANPSSMEAAIKNFAAMPFDNKILVLGDMFELGVYAKQEHKNIADLCTGLGLKEVYLAGTDFCNTETSYKKFETTEALKQFLQSRKITNSTVFMKGSRGMKLESLLEVL